MNYIGSYHTELKLCANGACDAPCRTMGRMSLAGTDTAADPAAMALAHGMMRNRSALAKELGCTPDASQAELVLAAYHRWDEEYVYHIEGPCMSCIMDREKDRLILARDRMGECCLFFASDGERLVFADHPDTILKTGFVQPVLDRNAACELFGLGPARTPGKTMLAGMESLKSGCMMLFTGGEMRIRDYYTLEAKEHEENERVTVEHTRDLLEKAVDSFVHLHPSCMLSGGLDSTALTALMRKRIGRLESFSVDYEGNDSDFVANDFRPEKDAPYIQLAAASFGTIHRGFVLSQNSLADALDEAVRLRGFPGMGDIDASLMLFAKKIAGYSHAVISGECGDEVFGGYPWFRNEKALEFAGFPWSGSMELRSRILRREIRDKLCMEQYVRDALHQSLDSYDVSTIEDKNEQKRFKLQRLCFDYFMPNLQERAVKMCEGAGVSVFTPLCDDRLAEYVYSVPWKIKTMGGAEKGLFRAAVADLLPEKLLMRKKSPYPKTCSPVYANLVRDRVCEMIRDEKAPVWRLADREFVEKLASSALNPADTPWFGQLMAGPQLLSYIIQINTWMAERNIAVEL